MRHIYATFANVQTMEKVGGALLDHGIPPEHISMVLSEVRSPDDDGSDARANLEATATTGITTTTVADAASGSVKGAGIGLAAGTLAALAAVFLPGFGLVLGGGALALAIGGLAGSTAAGAVAGGITGYLKDQGVPSDHVEEYREVLQAGGGFVTITTNEDATDTAEIEALLTKYGGTIRHYRYAVDTAGVATSAVDERVHIEQ